MTANVEGAEGLLIVSDDPDWNSTQDNSSDGPIVYFYGIEGISSAELQFNRGEDFPERFVIHQDGVDTTATFSNYNEETATFSVTMDDGVNNETYNDLVLNSGVFTAYTYDASLTGARIRE